MLALRKKKFRKNSKSFLNNFLLDQEYGLYVEDYFNRRVSFEGKRVERSKRPLMMILFNIGKIVDLHEKKVVIEQIQKVISSVTRETDLSGWYRHLCVIGVLFTEINKVDEGILKEKICQTLCRTLDIEQILNIKVSFRWVLSVKSRNPGEEGSEDLISYFDVKNPLPARKLHTVSKRGMDIVGSLLALLVFSPFLITIPTLIKLTSKGPVVFKQERVGLNGKRFTFYKFRSMKVGNSPEIHKAFTQKLITGGIKDPGKYHDLGAGAYKIKNDNRVLPFGRFLRKTSLDELPQIINVLTGEMSLVGPRPPIPYELDNYDIWHKRRLLQVKPGITGLWQVKGRSTCTFDEMVRLDLKYIRKQSLWLDIKILLQTPWVVVAGRGAV